MLFDRAKPRSVNGKTRNRTVHRSPLAVEVLAALSHESGDPCVVPGGEVRHTYGRHRLGMTEHPRDGRTE